MSFFNRTKKSEIPPVDEGARNDHLTGGGRYAQPPPQQQQQSRYGDGSGGPQRMNSTASAASGRPPTYASGSYSSWDPRSQQPPQGRGPPGPSQYQQQGYGQPSGYGQQPRQGGYRGDDGDQNRRELFKDARPVKSSFGGHDLDQPYSSYGRNGDDYEGEQQEGGMQDEDEEVEAVKQQMRFTKQESLASTRNALRAAREAEETGRNTLTKLGDQSERLANTERALDMTKAHNDRAADEAREIKSLNKSIFRPSFTWNKSAKRDAAERKILDRHHEEREEREETRRQVFESRERIGNTFRQAERDQRAPGQYSSQAANSAASKLSGRSRYQFEADEEDDQVESELNSNLDEIGQLSKSLNLLARAAGEEVRTQNSKLDTLNNKTDRVDTKIVSNGLYLNRLK